MFSLPLTTFFLILGLVFLFIAVIGQARLGFAEINPGGCGRFLAFILGIFSLGVAVTLAVFPIESVDVIRTYLTDFIQQNMNALTQFQLPSFSS